MEKTRPCIRDFLEVSRRCLGSKDKTGLNITLNMIDAAIDFVCHNSGDRLACKCHFYLALTGSRNASDAYAPLSES